MTVRLVGEGPGLEAVEAALGDVDVPVERGDVAGLEAATVGVVSATAGDETFARANEVASRWVAIEIGGVGGHPIGALDAAVSGFGPESACYACLRQRVAANLAPEEHAEAPSADRSAVRLAGAIAGREIVRALAGEDRLTGHVVEAPRARRRLLPVPGCGCGDGHPESNGAGATTRELPVPRDHEVRSLEETVERMDGAIDDRIGIVGQIGEVESFPAAYYLATLADTSGFSDGDAPDHAAGVADDWNAALAKGVGEALERYTAAIYREDEFHRAAPSELPDAVPPSAFAGADADAPGADATDDLPWVRAERLRPGERADADATDETSDRAWLPASAVHFPPPSERSLPGITTGLGLGSSPVDALLAGLAEVIERDATMLAWYSTFEPLGLAVDDEAFERLARRARGEGLSVTPLLVTQDVDVPVVAVALHREDPWPRFAVGSAASLYPVDAATGALAEAIQNWMELRSTGRDEAPSLAGAIGHYANRPPAADAFVDPNATVPAADVGPADPPEGPPAVDALVEALGAADLDAYAARLTTRDLAELGFEAVRVAVPAAQPLFTDDARFGERARTVPGSMGYEPRLEREQHPYP